MSRLFWYLFPRDHAEANDARKSYFIASQSEMKLKTKKLGSESSQSPPRRLAILAKPRVSRDIPSRAFTKEFPMNRLSALFLSIFTGVSTVAAAQSTQSVVAEYPRQLVEMPAQALALMRQDMLDHLGALTRVVGLVGNGQFQEAAKLAESQLGRSAMGKHRSTGTPPGRYMPEAMRALGMGMHAAASEFAVTAQTEDQAATLAALQSVMSSCVACHSTFRTH
jgi:hypothetical protein